MFDIAQNVVIFVITVAATLLLTYLLNRLWPPQLRRLHNDVIGWQLGILGTTYAVILGFMLYTVWTDFGAAQLNLDLEASSLRNVYAMTRGLPPQQAAELRQECRLYAETVLTQDWPTMDRDRTPEQSHVVNQTMWNTIMSMKSASPTETIAEDHTLSELTAMTEHRRTRLLQSAYTIPSIFWFVLLVGGVVTVASAALFGAKNNLLHSIQVLCFTSLVTLVLLAINDVNRPFSGWIRVNNYAFVRAQQNMLEH